MQILKKKYYLARDDANLFAKQDAEIRWEH
jgi:hypothetical protein